MPFDNTRGVNGANSERIILISNSYPYSNERIWIRIINGYQNVKLNSR